MLHADQTKTTGHSSQRKPRVVTNIGSEEVNRLKKFIVSHSSHVSHANTKPTELKGDVDALYIESAFKGGNKDQVLLLLEYGIDVFSTVCNGQSCDNGQERWIIDFYGVANTTTPYSVLVDQKMVILKEYRRQRWKIGVVGGSVSRFNRRRNFIAFLERYVMNPKNTELRERVKEVMAIALVQSCIASFI